MISKFGEPAYAYAALDPFAFAPEADAGVDMQRHPHLSVLHDLVGGCSTEVAVRSW